MKVDQMDKLIVINKNSKCSFCGNSKNDCLKYGPIYQLGNITAHYYCVLLSNRLIQNGNDNEGILGFLLSDIQKELLRTSEILCSYCKKGNATIKCASRRCKRSFHLPCGIKGGSLHEFANQFKSFCHIHRPVQNIPQKILKEAQKSETVCCICYEKVDVKDKIKSLWAPCCSRTWYHRFCIQKLAHSAGYFFRCAACNDVQKFNKWMQRFGIFIPQQDASWELVPNAFEDLLYRHNNCDAEECRCPDGRQKNEDNTIWEIILCESCGSQGIHIACGNLKFIDPEWECISCQKITRNIKCASKTSDSLRPDEGSSKFSKLTEVCNKKRRRGSEDLMNSFLDKRKKCRIQSEEDKAEDGEEVEIDVETVEEELIDNDVVEKDKENNKVAEVKTNQDVDLQEILAILKPGPLSYKLSLVRKIYGASPPKAPTQGLHSFGLIDSDEEEEEADVKLIKKNVNSEEGFKFISPPKIKEGSTEEKEGDFISDITSENEDNSGSMKLTFSVSVHSNDDQLCILNDFSPKTAFVKEMSHTNTLEFFLSPVKSRRCFYFEKEHTVQDYKLSKSESDFREEEDFRSSSDDEVVILTD